MNMILILALIITLVLLSLGPENASAQRLSEFESRHSGSDATTTAPTGEMAGKTGDRQRVA